MFSDCLYWFRVVVYRFQYLLQLDWFLGWWLRVERPVHHLVISHLSTDTCGRLPIVDDVLNHQVLVRTSLSWPLGIVLLFRVGHIVLSGFLLNFGILLTPVIVSLLLLLLKNWFLEGTGDQCPTLPLVIALHRVETHVKLVSESCCSAAFQPGQVSILGYFTYWRFANAWIPGSA